MGAIFDLIIQKASSEVSNLPPDKWLENLLGALKSNVSKISDPTFAAGASDAIAVLESHKADLANMGSYSLTLFLQQLASGDVKSATLTYIRNQADPQELIDGMNKGADGIIQAKIKLDAMEQTALVIAKDMVTAAAKYLLPMILSLI